jgi:thiaminase
LGDKPGALGFYNILVKRFPTNPNLPAVYYSMYRLYSELNDTKADEYKNRLLKNYPETAFAKVILDPDYSKKLNDKDAEANSFYSEVYDLYAHKKYADVMSRVDEIMKEYPTNKYAAQLYYLKAIAAGHQETTTQFESDLQQIAKNYPNDRLITPLVNQHINYINANLVDMSARHFALSDADSTEVPFTPPVEFQKQTAYRAPGREMHFNTVAEVKKPEIKPSAKVDSVKKLVAADPLLSPKKTPPKPTISNLFSLKDSTEYYFVVNISNDNTNLASSRFGIGQFNRANLQDQDVKHQLMDAGDNNRLIYVGRFYSLAAVKKYARAIIPLMPEIMKVQKDKYSFFIITKQNLDKITDKKTLDSYIDYYQSNY